MKSKISKNTGGLNTASEDHVNLSTLFEELMPSWSFLEFYPSVLIRIRQQPVRPAESSCETSFSVTECDRDCQEILNRSRVEGLPFLTRTLPLLGKAIDKALLGDSDAFVSIPFKKARDSKLPVLFGEMLRRVFDSNGCTRSDADAQSVRLLRQLTFSYYKLDVPYDQELEDEVINNFCEVDKNLPIWYSCQTGRCTEQAAERLSTLPTGSFKELDGVLDSCAQIARYIVAVALGSRDPREILPRHGPGAVATGERGPEKAKFTEIIERLERVYPFMEYMKFNLTHVSDTWDTPLTSRESGTAKVVLVPKDSRGPRLISCEPLSNQWIQQGQMRVMVDALEAHPLTRGQVNFRDQSINGKLALRSSLSREFATLDMKDASDRVSWALVELLFPENWKEALFASRSPNTKLPNGSIVQLKKFAPMGSAVCFPVEALCFFALAVGAVYCKQLRIEQGSLSLTAGKIRIDKRRLRKIASTIFVYGDDIVCRTEDCGSIQTYLANFDLKFNEAKCCIAGHFRESCGVDAFQGVNVSPTRFRVHARSYLPTPQALVSWVEYSNSLFEKGYWRAGEYIKDWIQETWPIPTLYTPDGTSAARKGGIFFYRPFPGAPSINPRRWFHVSKDPRREAVQGLEALTWTTVVANAETTDIGWDELLRVQSLKGDAQAPITGGKMAGVYADARRFKLKRAWVSIDSNQ